MRKRIRGWRGWLAAVALLTALALADLVLARGPVAYCPEDARWVVTAADFPAFYRDLLETDLAKAVNDEAPEHYAEWQLAVRQATGIRPTPLRWRVWLGPRLVAAASDDGWGACVRPGIILRVADSLRGLGGWRPAVRQFGPYYYAWRDGALIFSKSEKYVLASFEAEPFDPPRLPMTSEVWAFESRAARSAVCIRPGRHIYVTGWLETGAPDPDLLSPDLDLLPEDAAIAWVAAPDMQSLRDFAGAVYAVADRHTRMSQRPSFKLVTNLLQKAAKPWKFDALPPDWDRQLAGCLLVLLDVDDSEPLPVPEVGLIFDAKGEALGSHPLEPLTANGPAMPYEWDGRPGVVAPRAGEKAALCLTSMGSFWLAASQEPAMTRLLRAIQKPREPVMEVIGRFAIVAVNWSKVAGKTESLARQAAKIELLPSLNTADFEKTAVPLLRVLHGLGSARLHFSPSKEDGRRLEFHGALTGEPGL